MKWLVFILLLTGLVCGVLNSAVVSNVMECTAECFTSKLTFSQESFYLVGISSMAS